MAAILPGRIGLAMIFLIAFALSRVGALAQPWRPQAGIASTRQLTIGGAILQIDFANGPTLDLPLDAILKHIQMAASAVTAYYGRFPVARARILVVPVPGGRGEEIQGTTWGGVDGYQGFTRLRIAQHTTDEDLKRRLGHHTRNGSHGFRQHARRSALDRRRPGHLHRAPGACHDRRTEAKKVWADMVHGMRPGRAETGRRGPRSYPYLGAHLLGRGALLLRR